MNILGTNHVGKTRRDALIRRKDKKDIKLRRDYAERLVAAFKQVIQSEHFGANKTLSMEGVAVEYVMDGIEDKILGEFHSYLSDDS